MVSLNELVDFTNTFLASDRYEDYCPNGLQVQGRAEINKIVSGVTASQQLIDAAILAKADVLLVHHGYFWRNESPCIVGMKYQRLKKLLDNNISLLAYHLPLDEHPEIGNNVQLAKVLGFQTEPVEEGGSLLIRQAVLPQAITGEALAQHIEKQLSKAPVHVAAEKKIKRIAWCTGAAQSYIDKAIGLDVDAYITGEISESTTHSARENGIHFYAAGHHATERYGVQALGKLLSEQFLIEHEFIDCDNPA